MSATQLNGTARMDFSCQSPSLHASYHNNSDRVSTLGISNLLSAASAETGEKSFLAYLWTPFTYIGALLSKIWEKFLNVILWRSSKNIDVPSEVKIAPFQELLQKLEAIQNDPQVLSKWQAIWKETPEPVKEALIEHDGFELAKNNLIKQGKKEEEITIEDLKTNLDENRVAYREISMDLFSNLDLKNGASVERAINTLLAILNKKIDLLKEGSV